jgi:hypothetical protein
MKSAANSVKPKSGARSVARSAAGSAPGSGVGPSSVGLSSLREKVSPIEAASSQSLLSSNKLSPLEGLNMLAFAA